MEGEGGRGEKGGERMEGLEGKGGKRSERVRDRPRQTKERIHGGKERWREGSCR